MMKHKRLLTAVKTLAFLLIFVFLFGMVSSVFQPKWYTGNAETDVNDTYYECPKDSIEALFFGSSQIVHAIDTMELYQNYGIYSYVFGGSRNSILSNYYRFLEVLQRQRNVKSVVIDMSMVHNNDPAEDAAYRKSIALMRPSVYKYKAIWDYCRYVRTPENEDNSFLDMFTSYLFGLYNYHTRWNELDEVDFGGEHDRVLFNGFKFSNKIYTPVISYEKFLIENDKDVHPEWFFELEANYLNKLIEECQKRDIEILLIKTPKTSWDLEGYKYCQTVAEKYGIDYFDFNTDEYFKAADLDYQHDLYDKDHLNVRGAVKVTDYIADYLVTKKQYTDCRDKGYNTQETIEQYALKEQIAKMRTSFTAPMLLQSVPTQHTTVFIQSDGNVSAVWTKQCQEQLEALGIQTDITKLGNQNFLAVIDNGEVVYENSAADAFTYEYQVSKKQTMVFNCDGSESTAKLNKKTFSYRVNGLHFIVYNQIMQSTGNSSVLCDKDGKIAVRYESVTPE